MKESQPNQGFLLSDRVPRANFLRVGQGKEKNRKKIKKITKYVQLYRHRVDGVVGVRMLGEGTADDSFRDRTGNL
jgi:hypothetical protein